MALIVVGLECPAAAKVAPVPFERLVQSSDIIVVAQVESVHTGWSKKKMATASVLEAWKGESGEAVKFLASPKFTCDINDAVEGERVVLFLYLRPFRSSYIIAHRGRGRMPITDIDGNEYATIWSKDIILPEGTPTLPGMQPEYGDFIRSIDLEILKDAVQNILESSETQSY
jgi:hypothetical protein